MTTIDLTTPPAAAAAPDSTTNITSSSSAAVLNTENVHINLNANSASPPPAHMSSSNSPAVIEIPKSDNPGLRTIELSSGRIREGFGRLTARCIFFYLRFFFPVANGDIIVTLLPINTKWPWITPAVFRPELVPEELMAQGLTVRKLYNN